jgi:uncharacterized OB-fold protein
MEVMESVISDEEVVRRLPGVRIDEDSAPHWKGLLEKRLLIPRCQECGYWIFPIRDFCSECWSTNVKYEQVSGKGSLYLFVIYHQGMPIPGVDYSTPYPVGAGELVEQKGLRFLAPLVEVKNEDIKHDMPLELTWIERAGEPAPAWKPAGK